jgi:hypothetical protein
MRQEDLYNLLCAYPLEAHLSDAVAQYGAEP